MRKILFAINHKKTEEQVAQHLGDDYLAVGAVAYKEAVLEQLRSSGADILVIRETLPGSSNFEGLLKRVRVENPDVRIVVICSYHPKNDPLLQALVGLGIYDIINSDKPTITDIVSYVRSPRTFRDAAQYGIGLPEVPGNSRPMPQPEIQEPEPDPAPPIKKKLFGFFDDVAKGFSVLTGSNSNTAKSKGATREDRNKSYIPETVTPQVNFNLLRESIKESEARKAQGDLDKLIQEAVKNQTVALMQQNEELKKELDVAETEKGVAESHSANLIEELNSIRAEKDNLVLTLTDTRRDMQQVIDMYETQLKALHDPTNTPEWYSEQLSIWETQKNTLTTSLQDKTREAEELSFKCNELTQLIQNNSTVITELKEKLQRAQDMQLSDRGSNELIAKLRDEASDAKFQVLQLQSEIDKMREELEVIREGGPDYSFPNVEVPLLPDDTIYTSSATAPQTIMVVGSKHGVGTTTAALNIASSLALKGLKTLLIEVNGNFPLCNHYFEFTHIPFGIDEAISAISEGNIANIDKAIIRPHGLRPVQTNLYKTYKKLPAGLHFMLFSNDTLFNHNYDKNMQYTEATVFTLLNYLTKRQQYSHVIIDIQPDDYKMIANILNSGYQIDKLCMVISQDPHAIISAGTQITTFSRAHASSLIAGAEFIINKFNANIPVNTKKIKQILKINSSQISKLSNDETGYISAINSGLPYVISKGHYWSEYDTLRNKIFPA